MAINQLVLLSFLLLLPLATFANPEAPAKPDDHHINVVIEGKVYCQSCDRYGTWSLTGAQPIPKAIVSVICKNHKKRVSFYKTFKTDANGYFYAELKDFHMGHYILDHPLHSCHVKLVSSPLEKCNLLSNVNNALNGAPLRYDNKRLYGKEYEAVVYAAGPLAFRPDNCTYQA